MEFEPVRRQSIADDITAQIIRQILQGAIKPGERLPPERELAVTFNTNRNTLREAIRNLQTMHLVDARQGDGLRVRDFRDAGEINLLPFYLRETTDYQERAALLEDALRVRRLLLGDVCSLLAERAQKSDLAEIRKLIDSQKKRADDPEKLVRTDLDISLAMVRASGSLGYRWLFNTFAQFYREVAFALPSLWLFTSDYVDALHAIVDAAARGDARKAGSLMVEHLEASDAMILKALKSLREMLD
jgi:GntR family transcriptional repressor for pyruvate dehydrogenase complex